MDYESAVLAMPGLFGIGVTIVAAIIKSEKGEW